MATSITDVHKIVVTVSEPDLIVEPGTVSQLTVTILNQQDAPDRLSLEIEGIDVEWYAIPVPAVNLAAGAQAVLKVPFRVARSSSNRAGTYPFLVRVQAMETGEVGVAQASLSVKPYNALQVELNPKRLVATFFHPLNDDRRKKQTARISDAFTAVMRDNDRPRFLKIIAVTFEETTLDADVELCIFHRPAPLCSVECALERFFIVRGFRHTRIDILADGLQRVRIHDFPEDLFNDSYFLWITGADDDFHYV